jgi:hypothetical protein
MPFDVEFNGLLDSFASFALPSPVIILEIAAIWLFSPSGFHEVSAMLRRSGLMALVLMCGLAAGEAQAQCGNGYGGGYGYWDIGRLYQVLSQNVPYYAAFPPVYYSAPVPRSYGYSPFAYPPGTMTPEVVETVSAQEIVNPYMVPTSTQASPAEEDKVTNVESSSGSLVVINPFVESNLVRTAATSTSR